MLKFRLFLNTELVAIVVWPLYVVGPAVDYPTYYALPLYADQFPYTELQPIDGQLLGEEQQSENPLAVRDQVYNEQPISKGGLPLVRGLFGNNQAFSSEFLKLKFKRNRKIA